MGKNQGSAGRFGSRYGKRIRKRVSELEKSHNEKYECPGCGSLSLVRETKGVWKCKKCGKKVSGGAWKPKTGGEKLVKRALRRASEEEE